jgi:hypothetical protein
MGWRRAAPSKIDVGASELDKRRAGPDEDKSLSGPHTSVALEFHLNIHPDGDRPPVFGGRHKFPGLGGGDGICVQ